MEGQTIALISDAGTPLISDPGYRLVHEARLSGVAVVPVPGACALIAALSASGLPSDRFCFEGFLPPKEGASRARLETLAREERTLIFYESPHRLFQTLKLMQAVLSGVREIVIARELTKQFEEFFSGNLDAAIAWLEEDTQHQKGEFVILVRGAEAETELTTDDQRLMALLRRELPAKTAAKLASEITGKSKNLFYALQIYFEK
jgi:16S rRNA (cytidine1402-2'-O)-methyltransferase